MVRAADTTRTAVLIGYRTLRRRLRALQPRDSAVAIEASLLLEGLVVDQTRTRLGRQFYDLFYRRWEAPEGAAGLTVTVEERPAPGRGSVVTVRADGEVTFRARLQPDRGYLERAARAAIFYTRRAVL